MFKKCDVKHDFDQFCLWGGLRSLMSVYTLWMVALRGFGSSCTLWNGTSWLFLLNSMLCKSSERSQCDGTIDKTVFMIMIDKIVWN